MSLEVKGLKRLRVQPFEKMGVLTWQQYRNGGAPYIAKVSMAFMHGSTGEGPLDDRTSANGGPDAYWVRSNGRIPVIVKC